MNLPIVSASINLTKECNLRCSYCFTGGKTKEKISLEMAKKAVDYLINNAMSADLSDLPAKQRKIDISFWGGEPLLEWDLLQKIVLYAESVKPSELELSFGGTTNGTLLTADKFAFLDKHKIFFLLSLDGTEETHDFHRKDCGGHGSHHIIVKNAKEILAKWPFYKARMSLYPERIDHFYDDIKYLIDLGFNDLYFSPVYEYDWNDENWKVWESECYRVIDLLETLKRSGRKIRIEHFESYAKGSDNTSYPCGAGRGYVGIDTDGSIWPCHRFIKFEDTRHWSEKEWCFGHVEHGITKPEVREKFDNFKADCTGCECYVETPCHGGCYATNIDLGGSLTKADPRICAYVKMQVAVSAKYKEVIGVETSSSVRGCVCYNSCYLQNTKDEVIDIDPSSEIQCHCYNVSYSGNPSPDSCVPLPKEVIMKKVSPQDVINSIISMRKEVAELKEQIASLVKLLTKDKEK